MPVTNEDLMAKLEKIEAMLSTLAQEEEEELETLEGSNINLTYSSPIEWRRNIWEGCEFKMEKETGEELDFWCKKVDKLCRFETCPLNRQ